MSNMILFDPSIDLTWKSLYLNIKSLLQEHSIENADFKAKKLLLYWSHFTESTWLLNLRDSIPENIQQAMQERLQADIERLCQGCPVEYILGQTTFMGQDIYVDSRVLIPRADSEILVEAVLGLAKNIKQPLSILELCTGSGALMRAVSSELSQGDFVATDISEAALEVARKNLPDSVALKHSDLFDNIEGTFDIIFANPPYIAQEEMLDLSGEVLDYEPRLALTDEADGLTLYKRILNNAPQFLKPGGYLVIEHGYLQKEAIQKIAQISQQWTEVICQKDYGSQDRVLGWRKNT